MGSRKGIGLELVGIVSAPLVLLIWYWIMSGGLCGGRCHAGTTASNFYNFLGTSGELGIFGLLLIIFVPIFFLSVGRILGKTRGPSRREASEDESADETSRGSDVRENDDFRT